MTARPKILLTRRWTEEVERYLAERYDVTLNGDLVADQVLLPATGAADCCYQAAYSHVMDPVRGVVYLVLGLLLWRGEHRHGVRMIGTIMALVNVIGLIGLIATTGSSAFQQTSTLFADLLVQVIILVGMIMLWEGGGRRWEHEGA